MIALVQKQNTNTNIEIELKQLVYAIKTLKQKTLSSQIIKKDQKIETSQKEKETIQSKKRKVRTFGEGNYVIVLEAEAALAVAEALTDNVTSSVFAPPLRVSTWHYISLCPAIALCF